MVSNNIYIYFVGTAGCGKSSMTQAFLQWMKLKGLDAVTVNLDPGAEELTYSPDVDIREWVSLKEVMKEYGLGPNGAQIAAADIMALKVGELAKILQEFETNYILVDTPGQLELFSFRKSSGLIVNSLGGGQAVIAFAIDPLVSKTPAGLISQIMLKATVQFRFMVPTVGVLTKRDLLTEEEVIRIQTWATNAEALDAALTESDIRAETQINIEFLRALESVGALNELISVSSTEMYGFEDLYNMVQQVYMGGEDLTPD